MAGAPVVTIVRDDGLGEGNPRFVIDGTRWFLVNGGLEGFDGVGYEVSTGDYAQYDGAYLLGERSGTVDRTITARALVGRFAARREAEQFFVARRSYEVHVEYAGRSRYFVGRQYGFRLSVDPGDGVQELVWTALALDPYWLSEDEKRFDLAEAEGKAGFAFCSWGARKSPPGFVHVAGFVAGVIRREIWMDNAGGATAYPRFDVSATGEVKNPVIRILDAAGAEQMRVSLTVDLSAGDALTFDFSARPTLVLLNGEDASHLVRPGSTLAAGVEPGRFQVVWSADEGDAALSILPSIRERYASV